MRNLATVSILTLAVMLMLAAASLSDEPKDYWELVDAKTGQALGDQQTMEHTDKDLSKVPTYQRLILNGLGCASAVSSQISARNPTSPQNNVPGSAPCKFEKLYIDAGADGSPMGRNLATAIIKAVEKDGRVKLVANRKEADAVFACHDELVEVETSENMARLGTDTTAGSPHRWIAYMVETDFCDDSEADLTYIAGEGETEQRTVKTPWAMLAPYYDGTFYSLAAQKRDSSDCDIVAGIYDIRLTSGQSLYLSGLLRRDLVLYLHRHASQLREATSDTAYGIAAADYPGRDQ